MALAMAIKRKSSWLFLLKHSTRNGRYYISYVLSIIDRSNTMLIMEDNATIGGAIGGEKSALGGRCI